MASASLDKPEGSEVICQLVEIFENEEILMTLMEYCGPENLQEFLRPLPNFMLNEKYSRQVFWRLANGLKFMHSLGYCHRDIKMMNVVVNPIKIPGNQYDMRVKWVDFGFTWPISVMTPYHVGTESYKPPEVITKQHPYYCAPADVWSLAVLMYKTIAGRYPFGRKLLKF